VREVQSNDFACFERVWSDLKTMRPDLPVFAGFAWHRSWWEAVGQRQPGCAVKWLEVVNERKGSTIGIIPLMYVLGEQSKRLVSHSSPYADYFDIVCRPGEENRCCAALLRHVSSLAGSIERVELNSVRSNSRTAGALREVFPKRWIEETTGRPCPVVDLDRPEALRRAIGKKTTVLKKRRLQRLGNLEVQHLRSKEEIVPYFDHFKRWHQQRWSQHDAPVGLFSDPDVEQFFLHLLNNLPARRSIVVSALILNEFPLALCWGLLSSRVYAYYRSAFNPKYHHLSPGTVLLEEVIAASAVWGLLVFDFLRGDYEFKYRYANREVATVDITLCPIG